MDLEQLSKDTTIEICGSLAENYEFLEKIGEGTYGEVYRGFDKEENRIVAVKRFKKEQGLRLSSLTIREINIFQKVQHDNVATFHKVVFAENNVYIIMDYFATDLWVLFNRMIAIGMKFEPSEVQWLIFQLLKGVGYMHKKSIFHRDLKPSNLLITNDGIVKICDFGLSSDYAPARGRKLYSPYVGTRWYRAPEVLLSYGDYGAPIDLWSIGCIFAELCLMRVLFPGNSEIDQILQIFKVLGTPKEEVWKGYKKLSKIRKFNFVEYPRTNFESTFPSTLPHLGFELLENLLAYDPNRRFTAEEALEDEYFNLKILPTVPATNDKTTELPVKRKLDYKEPQSKEELSSKRPKKRKKDEEE